MSIAKVSLSRRARLLLGALGAGGATAGTYGAAQAGALGEAAQGVAGEVPRVLADYAAMMGMGGAVGKGGGGPLGKGIPESWVPDWATDVNAAKGLAADIRGARVDGAYDRGYNKYKEITAPRIPSGIPSGLLHQPVG
jgi:hypothetical protein